MSHSYEYRVGESKSKYKLHSMVKPQQASYVAEDAASDYYEERDGCEAKWPLDIEVIYRGKSLGVFEVHKVYNPEFIAMSKKEKNK